jgi:hypothetical protein
VKCFFPTPWKFRCKIAVWFQEEPFFLRTCSRYRVKENCTERDSLAPELHINTVFTFSITMSFNDSASSGIFSLSSPSSSQLPFPLVVVVNITIRFDNRSISWRPERH